VIHLLLFDMDSVLVDAAGYLAALQETVAHVARAIGAGEQVLTEEEVRIFEAYAIGSEWDIAPTCIGGLLVERLRREPALSLPECWPEALAYLGAHPHPLPRHDFGALAARVGARLAGRTGAARAAQAVLWEDAQAIPNLTPATARAFEALLATLLGDTHDFYRAPLTRHFQHLAIGSRGVEATYGVQPDFESPPYLTLYDHPLLEAAVRDRLCAAVAGGQVRMALYTARPSLPPAGVDGAGPGYSPEAELARDLVGLPDVPLIGLGRMQWLAAQHGLAMVELVKPSPVQGLAAIGAAWSGDERGALEAALAVHRDGVLRPPFAGQAPAAVHVFEDAVRGLDAVEHGVEALRAAGLSDNGAKRGAMAARGVPCYPSVNQAIEEALRRVVAT
jgi:hypothetical protein